MNDLETLPLKCSEDEPVSLEVTTRTVDVDCGTVTASSPISVTDAVGNLPDATDSYKQRYTNIPLSATRSIVLNNHPYAGLYPTPSFATTTSSSQSPVHPTARTNDGHDKETEIAASSGLSSATTRQRPSPRKLFQESTSMAVGEINDADEQTETSTQCNELENTSSKHGDTNVASTSMASIPRLDLSLVEMTTPRGQTQLVDWLNKVLIPPPSSQADHGSHNTKTQFPCTRQLYHEMVTLLKSGTAEDKYSDSLSPSPTLVSLPRLQESIHREIRRGRLRFRGDFPGDVGLRERAMSLLFSIQRPWLAAGVAAILTNESNGSTPDDVILSLAYSSATQSYQCDGSVALTKAADSKLRRFISQRFFGDANLLGRDNIRQCAAPSGETGKGYERDLKALVLERLLMLVIVLDRAKTNRLSALPLFVRMANSTAISASGKATKQPGSSPTVASSNPHNSRGNAQREKSVTSTMGVMVRLQREFIAAERDFSRHLQRLQVNLTHVQDPIEEYFSIPVVRLALDLADGIRLIRLAEVVDEVPYRSYLDKTYPWPASLVQQRKNIELFLQWMDANNLCRFSEANMTSIERGVRDPILSILHVIAEEVQR